MWNQKSKKNIGWILSYSSETCHSCEGRNLSLKQGDRLWFKNGFLPSQEWHSI